ncbi:erythromycin esterase family protein [Actinoplanes sp. LDG1-06]|uniref:Erythromycin esterase family protein n=1 Tax=Paractinoplanes ovalisporus TaxID=2810368 RepID=A0ABS2A599_9ACTN|nr:erythromycin esterase family protein [Actinoplanes ovalisporus]MBM2614900.1 erythromycin esterase family protein [Actinoplanes ovalisporus]
MDVLSLLPFQPRVLGLGEPTHGTEVLLEVRNELFQHLVERAGYRTITIESDCLAGLIVDDYVAGGPGTLEEVAEHGISHDWGASAANRELIRWMRAFNEGRPEADRVRFAGFDGPLEIAAAPSPRPALFALHALLEETDLLPCTASELDDLLGADEQWANPSAMYEPAQSMGRSPEARRLRLIADDLAALLESAAPGLGDVERARLYARTATGLLRYHYWMADTSPARLTWLLNVRASMMVANLRALAARGPVLAFGHNVHLQRTRGSMRMGGEPLHWWSPGAFLGADYAFLSMAIGTFREHGVGAPPEDTIEGFLYAQPRSPLLVDAAGLGRILGDAKPVARESPWFGYAALDPAQLPDIDAIVFVRDA